LTIRPPCDEGHLSQRLRRMSSLPANRQRLTARLTALTRPLNFLINNTLIPSKSH
jgi:hypothetical protein